MKLIYLFCLLGYFGLAHSQNSQTEAGAACIDGSTCADGRPSSLSTLVESLPQCPKFIIEQQTLRDEKSSLTASSPNEICLKGADSFNNHFKNAVELESYLQGHPSFSELHKKSSTSPRFSSCLSQGVFDTLGLGEISFQQETKILPENKKKLAVAEYYSSLKRISDGVERSLQNIAAIDLMIGSPSLLKGVPCNNLESLVSRDVKNQCQSVQQCSSSKTSASNTSVGLRESAKDTLLALKAMETIEREIKRLKGPRGRTLRKNRDKIQELEERKQSIHSLYPWILGKIFKDGYNSIDYAGYTSESSEESKKSFEDKMAGLIKDQLNHTREKLAERKEDLLKASSCIKGDESICEDLDVPKILAKTPPINHNEIFGRDRKKELKTKFEEGSLTPEESKEYRRLLTKVSEADSLFELTQCLQTQRTSVKEVNKELALGALDVGIVIGTMGLGSAVMAGRIALRVGGALSKAQKLSKAKRLQNLGVFGTDVSFSAPYMKEALNICEDQMNQLEQAVSEEPDNNKMCEKMPVRAKHTSDLKSCILQASLASLPITLPLLGLTGMAVAKKLRGAKTNSSAEEALGVKLSPSAEKAETVLGVRLNPSQQRAVEEAYLVGAGEKGKNGSLAGIGNYTQAQLRRKTEILQQAGLSPSQRRNLMESGVVGDDFIRNAGIKLEQDLQAIRNSPQEPLLREQGFKPSHYAGVDQAREFDRLHEYLREIQADPKLTHIPYFADQVEKTVADFERGLRTQNITGDPNYLIKDPNFLEKRLKILEEFKKEARRRVENQGMTYDWWVKFNTKLSLLASPSQLEYLLRSRYPHPVERIKMGVEIEYNRQLAQLIENALKSDSIRYGRIKEIEEMSEKLKSLDPEDIFFGEGYTSRELESMVFEVGRGQSEIDNTLSQIKIIKEDDWHDIDALRIREGIEALVSHGGVRGLNGRKEIRIPSINQASKEFPEEMMLFTTDELGIMAFNRVGNNSHFVGLSGNLENVADGTRLDSLEYLNHDIDHGNSIKFLPKEVFDRVNNISNKSDREKVNLVLFMYRHETAGGHMSYSSQFALERMMLGEPAPPGALNNMMRRWLNPEDLQGLLPDGVDVKDKSEVESFLRESATLFSETLSDLN